MTDTVAAMRMSVAPIIAPKVAQLTIGAVAEAVTSSSSSIVVA